MSEHQSVLPGFACHRATLRELGVLTIADIQREVADFYKIRLTELMSCRRCRSIARARQVAMWLAKRHTPRSMSEIGRRFDRDHTTVLYAIKRIDSLRSTDGEIRRDIVTLGERLGG